MPPLKRFLGLDDGADERRLLGLSGGALTPIDVDTALRRCLARVDHHPDGRSLDAQAVRERLRKAAARLRSELGPPRPEPPARPGSLEATLNPRRPPAGDPVRAVRERAIPGPAALRLTPFDQQVMAVLIGSGGWNARARSKLVSIASAYGVSVHGLLKVITGLSEYAKSGGPRLSLRQITAGQARLDALPAMPASEAPPPTSVVLQKLGEHLRDDEPWARIKVSAIFGLLTFVAGILLLVVILSGSPRAARQAADAGSPEGGGHDDGRPPRATARAGGPQGGAGRGPGPDVLPARFDRPPTFLGNALPVAATDAADQASTIPGELDDLARRLSVGGQVSESVFRIWADLVRSASTGWALMDDSTRTAIHAAILDVLYAASDAPAVSDRLLGELTPPGGRLVEPVDVWRGAWLAGTLATVAGNPNLPPVVTEQARNQFEIVLGTLPAQPTFNGAAARWLEGVVVDLVKVSEIDERVYDLWELWLAAQRELGRGGRYEAALLGAVRELLVSGGDLSRGGPSLDVLGRLLLSIDLTNSRVALERVTGLFDDEAVGTGDLWLLTSLLAGHDHTPWFTAELVLPADADDRLRRRLADRLAERWAAVSRPPPETTLARGSGKTVDAGALDRWRRRLVEFESTAPGGSDAALMAHLLVAANFNLAAALLAQQRGDEALDILDEIERALHGSEPAVEYFLPPVIGGRPRGQAVGRDGDWSDLYEQARSNAEEKISRLSALRSAAGTDLGPRDAATLVGEAYRGTPLEVRSIARDVIAGYFASGPNVAQALVDQFPNAAHNESLSEFVIELTGAFLPPARAEAWELEARLALVEHALELQASEIEQVDRLAELVNEAYSRRRRALENDRGFMPVTPRPPQHEAAELLGHWLRHAGSVMVAAPVPDTLAGLDRRHRTRLRLARGPMQQFVSIQLALVDLLAYVTAAEQPVLGPELLEALHLSRDRRTDMSHVLGQSIEAETMMARIWSIRMTAPREPDGGTG